jgi:hypothetical protein
MPDVFHEKQTSPVAGSCQRQHLGININDDDEEVEDNNALQ